MDKDSHFGRKIERIVQDPWTEFICRVFIGSVFIYASFHKIADPAQFAKIIYGYGLFPAISINLIAILLPYVEIVMGIALIFGVYPRAAAVVLSGILFVFVVAISINLIRGHEFDCGCFSFKNNLLHNSAWQLLFRDIIYFFLCLYLLLYQRGKLGRNKRPEQDHSGRS